jgi:hypothetical protein
MLKRQILITYGCGYTKGGYAGEPGYEAWMQEVRRAFAALGWAVTGQAPTQSSTHPEEDYLCLESDDGKLDQVALEQALAQVGILAAEYDGDVDGLKRSRSRRLAEYVEHERAARRVAADLPEIVPERGEPTAYARLTLNARRKRLDGYRFRTPQGQTGWKLHCDFVAPRAAIEDWGIAPSEGEWGGFWFFRTWWDYQEEGTDLPRKNRRVVPLLGKQCLKPETRYVVWFVFPHDEPVDVHVRVGLTKASATES